jgi:hypothetical protein
MNKGQMAGIKTRGVAGVALAVLIAGGGATRADRTALTTHTERQAVAIPGNFYCNIDALNPPERARHKELTGKLMKLRKEIVEMKQGYEFQYSPSELSLAELGDWVVAEAKCCPFFDFHIDLEKQGSLLCLRLTGAEGVKQFIRTEFGLKA